MAPNDAALLIAATVINGLAMILLLFRLFLRLQIRRFWWEDMWAAVVFLCGATFTISQLVCFVTDNYETALITDWIVSLTFTCTMWAARMSLLYSAIRVISPSSVLRTFTHVTAVFFLVFWATIIGLKAFWCAHNTDLVFLFGRKRPKCVLPEVEILFSVITDCISDAALVILSLRLLWRVKLPLRQRRMILTLFSSSAVMSVFSLFHSVCQLVSFEGGNYITFEAELTSALIVCNLLVVVTYVYRVFLSSRSGSLPSESESSQEDDDFTTPIYTNATHQLTTVDLNVTLDASTEVSEYNKTSGTLSFLHRSAA